MGKEPQRTDYYPSEVYARHVNEALKRGDKTFGDAHTYLVDFDSNFDRFVANVAFGLRHYVTYRSDGGRYARGLVRDSEEIKEIHKQFLKSSPAKGSKLRLKATLGRRKSPIATERWALLVHFAADIMTFDKDEGEHIEASPDVADKSRKNLTEKVLHQAVLVAQNIDRQNHNQGDRLMKVVKMADRLGYPRCLDLWYYASDHVRIYFDIHTTNEFRRKMTAQTGGKFPFDGWITQSSPEGWRHFPFKKMIKQCAGQDADRCHAFINNALLELDSNTMGAIHHTNRVDAQYGLGGASALGPLAEEFKNHLFEMQASVDNVLSAYKQ
jgi:hypothetical protein